MVGDLVQHLGMQESLSDFSFQYLVHRQKYFNNESILFPSFPTVQFLIACSMLKWRGKAWSILSRE